MKEYFRFMYVCSHLVLGELVVNSPDCSTRSDCLSYFHCASKNLCSRKQPSFLSNPLSCFCFYWIRQTALFKAGGSLAVFLNCMRSISWKYVQLSQKRYMSAKNYFLLKLKYMRNSKPSWKNWVARNLKGNNHKKL